MKSTFCSKFALDLISFLKFQRDQGYKYVRAESTLRNFDRFVTASLRHRRSTQLDQIMLKWLASRPNRKGCSVSEDMVIIKKFWTFIRRKYPRRYPRQILWPKLPTKSSFTPFVLSSSQIRSLIKEIKSLGNSAYEKALIKTVLIVLYCTGLRFGETTRLRICDVDLRRRAFFVNDSKGRSRWVPFDHSLAHELGIYLKKRRNLEQRSKYDNRHFFIRENLRTPTVSWISNQIRRLLRRTGLKPSKGRVGPRPYDLRHTFAVHRLTKWYRQGVDLHKRLVWLSAYMGHVDLTGTETYLTATPELLALAGHRFERRYRSKEKLP